MTLADRQKEFCGYLIVGFPRLSLPGLPMRSAAAIGGNGTQENLCQPVTTGAKDHGSDGTLQWRLERLDGLDGLKAWCAAHGLAWDTIMGQAAFTLHELTQPKYAGLLADLTAGTKSLETLTLNFVDAFERPSAAGREADKRIAYAHDCLAILMRDVPVGPALPPVVVAAPPISTIPIPSIGACQMPIELILQLIAPLAESLVTGLLKGALTHAAQTGTLPTTTSTAHTQPAPASGLTPADFAQIAAMIEKALAALNQPKAA